MSAIDLKKFAAPVPRYTSYPTAPHFSDAVGPADYRRWLSELPDGARISLYAHIPFCDQLCWYCGCNTKATQQYTPVAKYIESLFTEIDTVADCLSGRVDVSFIHWGGGSPNVLSVRDIAMLAERLDTAFGRTEKCEFAVEVDPRTMPDERIAAFAKAGVNRVSVGVQDFDLAVQKAINRMQSFETTRAVIEGFRSHGTKSVNIDLVYGLPHQTEQSLARTIEHVIELSPDRIAIFGYAHLPARLVHQRLIADDTLPGPRERMAQARLAGEMLDAAGYKRIGIDHFAKPGDALAQGRIHRNFQGYTTDTATTLIALGASAIGQLPQGYVQNATAVADYARRVKDPGLATARGHAFTRDDAVRAYAIERLMCDFALSGDELRGKFGDDGDAVMREARALAAGEGKGLISADDQVDVVRVANDGRPFVRWVCSALDAYMDAKPVTYSSGI